MSQFQYNSYHKFITGIIIVLWAVFHFTSNRSNDAYYDNGQIKRYESFKNGKNHGKWIWYYENGRKKMEGTFTNGERTGIWNTWDSNGNILTQGEYAGDKLNGYFIRWDASGKQVEKLYYSNDRVVQDAGNSKQ